MESVSAWFDAIYTDQYGRLIRIAYRHMDDPDLAQDIVQSVFETLLREYGKLKDHENIDGWLTKAVEYRIMTEKQKAHYTRELPFLPEHEPADAPLQDFMDLLPSGLTEKERQLLFYHIEAGMRHDEISARLGCTPEASRMRLKRAKEHCRELLLREKFFK